MIIYLILLLLIEQKDIFN